MLKSSFWKMYCTVATMALLAAKEDLCHKWSHICFISHNHNMGIFSCMIYHRVCKMSTQTGATSGAGTAYPAISLAFILIPSFSGVHVTLSSAFFVVFCGLLFVLLSFFVRTLYCLIIPLVPFLTCLMFKQYYRLMNFIFRCGTSHLIQWPIIYDHHYELNYMDVNVETYQRVMYPLK